MKINRRNFIKSVGAGALVLASARLEIGAQNPAWRLKIVVFWEESFPRRDGIALTKDSLSAALKDHETVFATADELATKLAEKGIDLFINPYGSAFPKPAWTAILKYLQAGGNLLNIGGAAFSVPVHKRDGIWQAEIAQVNYHKRLGILQYAKVPVGGLTRYETGDEKLKNLLTKKIAAVYEPYVRLTNTVEFPDESGSDGAREANLQALMFGYNDDERLAAPIVQFDRLRGEFAGGRWILIGVNVSDENNKNFDAASFKILVETASFGALEISVKSDLACYHRETVLKLKTIITRPANARQKAEIYSSNLLIKQPAPAGKTINVTPEGFWQPLVSGEYEINLSFQSGGDKKDFSSLLAALDINQQGFYQAEISRSVRLQGGAVYQIKCQTGFWVYDKPLMQAGEPFTADRHFLYRNGEPFPVTGTTYMASDVHRRFLLEPNPAIWDKDFAEIKAAGVNMIRTGIWTGWKSMIGADGNVKEEVLRAFEAFILTAKKYDIPVIFTFFAFMPEMFGGKNAYLDPQAIAGQKRFISAFAARVKDAKDVSWDLINEPSFANPKALWSCRPNHDEFEKAAWREWLMRRHAAKDENDLREILSEKWRLTTEEDALALPKEADFENVNLISDRRPLKVSDFRLFAQYAFKSWAQTLREALQSAGNSSQMITVGQDEAGTGDSPSPQFHAEAVDFTCLHNWWSNDDLLWDNVVSKSPSKPNLVEESGVMSYEKLDGAMWRDEIMTGQLLEKKMALGLGANACGFIEWAWNTNPYMNVDNEAGIGFLRPDGTSKPELAKFKRIAEFANANRKYFRGKKDEKTLLVIPHASQFTPRSLAQEATRKAVRALQYNCRCSMRAVSEYNLDEILKEKKPPALIIVPSPQMLSETAMRNLMHLLSDGATLAITGYFFDDESLIRQNYSNLFEKSQPIPVASYERVMLGEKRYEVRFAGEKMQRIFKSSTYYEKPVTRAYGDGNLLWCPLPLELGETIEPIAAFYELALKEAKLTPYFSLAYFSPDSETNSVLIRPTEFEDVILYTAINEKGDDNYVWMTHLPTGTKIQFNLREDAAEMFFLDKQTGSLLAKTWK